MDYDVEQYLEATKDIFGVEKDKVAKIRDKILDIIAQCRDDEEVLKKVVKEFEGEDLLYAVHLATMLLSLLIYLQDSVRYTVVANLVAYEVLRRREEKEQPYHN